MAERRLWPIGLAGKTSARKPVKQRSSEHSSKKNPPSRMWRVGMCGDKACGHPHPSK